jgi:Phage integrase family
VPPNVTDPGDTLHVPTDEGRPLQLSVTVPVNPFSESTSSRNAVVCPTEIVCDNAAPGWAAIIKSVASPLTTTVWVCFSALSLIATDSLILPGFVGTNANIPLNARALSILSFWASLFPNRDRSHYVFPCEKYGLAQRKDEQKGSIGTCVHGTDHTKPIGRWKEAWEAAKIRAGVQCRFHDLRHTGCTRMLEAGVPFSVVATIMGWSASTTVRMAKRYGHIGQIAQRLAVETLCEPVSATGGAQNGAQSENASAEVRTN